ncbi:hypothetical protein [Bacillus salipaludis]|uniref:Uncharacterized protein n=1 Tax=Bacillus salipaludis TaxID=2547811 RepID=A0AA90R3T0_9BACI|nr:hypothetical protein [Bacillus salipaludis]MDQ6595068.1 hypothetical protein [Bacillus salipaludis]
MDGKVAKVEGKTTELVCKWPKPVGEPLKVEGTWIGRQLVGGFFVVLFENLTFPLIKMEGKLPFSEFRSMRGRSGR